MPDQAHADAQHEQLLLLLRQSARGNQAAFHRLYELSSPRLYAVALRIMRQSDLADEVLQETYVKIWYNARDYISERGSVLTWMVSILRYRAIDRLRKMKREIVTDSADDKQESISDDKPGPLELINAAVDAKLLHGCLEDLGDKQKHSIALAFFEGLTHEQLSSKLKAPLGTVKSWIRRGLVALRKCINDELQQPGTH